MQVLVVHHDVEVGEQLVRMVEDYTAHTCAFTATDADALEWARAQRECSVLLVQLESPEVDGLSIGGSLAEIFAGLQTIFLPSYAASEQRLEVTNPKVFPEPIDGERLLKAIDRAAGATSYRALDLFHVVDVLQMCSLSRRTGAIQIVKGARTALVFLREGQIVHAEHGAARGVPALAEMVSWEAVEFAYDASMRAPGNTVSETWEEVLIEAVLRNDRNQLAAGATLRELRGDGMAAGKKSAPPTRRGFFGVGRRG